MPQPRTVPRCLETRRLHACARSSSSHTRASDGSSSCRISCESILACMAPGHCKEHILTCPPKQPLLFVLDNG